MTIEVFDYRGLVFVERQKASVKKMDITQFGTAHLTALTLNWAMRYAHLLGTDLPSSIARAKDATQGVLHAGYGSGRYGMTAPEFLAEVITAAEFGAYDRESMHGRQTRVGQLSRNWSPTLMFGLVSHIAARLKDPQAVEDAENDFLLSMQVLDHHQDEARKHGIMVTDSPAVASMRVRARADEKLQIRIGEQEAEAARQHEAVVARSKAAREKAAENAELERLAELEKLNQPELQDDDIAALAEGSGSW